MVCAQCQVAVRRCCLRPSRLDFRRRSLRKKLAGGAALNETQDLHSAWVGGAARWGGLVIGMFYTPAVHDEPFGSDVRISNGRQRLFRPEGRVLRSSPLSKRRLA
jgi:hypothetical protein